MRDHELCGEVVAPETAALIEPFAISAHAVRRANFGADGHGLVVGAGPIGLSMAAIAAGAGAKVAVTDTSEFRRAYVTKELGVVALDSRFSARRFLRRAARAVQR